MFTYHGITIEADEILKYSRKSRTDDPLLSVEEVLEKHEKILNEWCERNLGKLVPAQNSFQEIGSGETIEARPDFQNVLRLIESPKYKAILTVDIQRLSRGDLEDAGRIMKLLRYTNTLVITPDMVFNLNNEYDRDRFKREMDRGNDYLEYYKKINLRGRLESVRAGYYIGSVPPYGYDQNWVMDGRKKRPSLKINEREAEAVRMIFDLYGNENWGLKRIALHLNKLGYKTRKGKPWSTATLRNILENVQYTGKVIWNYRKTVTVVEDGVIKKTNPRSRDFYIFEGKHPAIISDELFEKVKEKRGKNPRVKDERKIRNPLAGLVYCQCGRAMSYKTYKGKDGKSRCNPRLACDNQSYCHTKSVSFDDVLEKVADVLRQCIAEFEIKIKNDKENTLINHTNNIARLEARLEALNQKELSQWEKYSEEAMPKAIFDKLNEKVLTEKQLVTEELERLRVAAPTVEEYQERLMLFTDALEGLKNPNVTAEAKNRLIKACIDRIEYTSSQGREKSWTSCWFDLDVTLKPFS